MNPIQRLSVTLAKTPADEEPGREAEIVDRDDWLSRVSDVARRLRAATGGRTDDRPERPANKR